MTGSSEKPIPTLTAGGVSQYPVSDCEQQSGPTSPVHLEEEGEVSDQETGTGIWSTHIRGTNLPGNCKGVRSFMG